MKTTEEYHNLVILLKQGLKFYADNDNYIVPHIEDGDLTKNVKGQSMVQIDGGSQATFALNKINEFLDERDEKEKEFVDNLKKAIEANEDHDKMMGLINAYKTQREKNES